MKKIRAIIYILPLVLIFTACAEKEKIDTSQAPEEIRNAVEKSYALSEDLTNLQLAAIKDEVIDSSEIALITDRFATLAVLNNINKANYGDDKFFIALTKEYKEFYDSLALETTVVRDCKGYGELWLSIHQKALEVKDVTELPAEQETIMEEDTLITPVETTPETE